MKFSIIPLLASALLCSSCKMIKLYSNQEIISKDACANITLTKKIPLVDVVIDGVPGKFIFDTGSTVTCITDSTIIKDFSNLQFVNFSLAFGADGKKIKKRAFSATLQSKLVSSENKVVSVINLPAQKCNPIAKTYSGILGLDSFFENKLGMKLDFGNSEVCNLSERQIHELLQQEKYREVKSSFRYKKLYIFIIIEKKEYKFLLDSGYGGCILIPLKKKIEFPLKKKTELEGMMHMTASSFAKGKDILYDQIPLRFGDENLDVKVDVSSSLTAQNIGIEFMKGFDWIIDYQNKKIYVKRNNNQIESVFNRKISYYSKVEKDKLIISIKEISQTKYNIGDEIISVNGQKVTAENSCEMQDFLNKTEDWNILKLEVVPKSK